MAHHNPALLTMTCWRIVTYASRRALDGSVANVLSALWWGKRVKNKRPALFRGRHFQDEIIVLCLRWYLRYSLSYRDLEEMMAERGLSPDHSTIARWVLRYASILSQRIRGGMRRPNRSWRVDETYVRVAGRWVYLYRAVDSEGDTIDFMLSPNRDLTAAKHFLRLAL
jgi:IS6 family transposase